MNTIQYSTMMTPNPENQLGLELNVVRLVSHDDLWPALFQTESARLHDALAGRIGRIEHIGSTAIDGIDAKPILDIMASIDDFNNLPPYLSPLANLGYEYHPDDYVEQRHFFMRKNDRGLPFIHFSLATETSAFWSRQIFFRDYLLANPQAREVYSALKHQLAQEFPGDRRAYVEGKTEFIEAILKRAGCPWNKLDG